jgi:hypothetical protein
MGYSEGDQINENAFRKTNPNGRKIMKKPNEPKTMNFHTENKGRINMKWKLQNEPNATWPKRPRFGSFPPAAGRPHSGFWLRTSDFILKMTKRTHFKNC